MKLWIDDVRPIPYITDDGWIWCKSVNVAKKIIAAHPDEIELISIDHDAGEYVNQGGDYLKLLDWLEEAGYNYPIHIHSQNVVGIMNMRRIIQHNGWKEIV